MTVKEIESRGGQLLRLFTFGAEPAFWRMRARCAKILVNGWPRQQSSKE
jgi:hypothetical protein